MSAHGTESRYTQLCRCDLCRAAHTAAARLRRKRRQALIRFAPSAAAHGSLSTYSNYGCRCDDCSAASAEYRRALKARNTASVPKPSDASFPTQ